MRVKQACPYCRSVLEVSARIKAKKILKSVVANHLRHFHPGKE